ncbi:recombinase family protein [Deinococcus humi]|uniref:DNA invertase Pin-like site-specific DNA recombinase n=1 Tax=Deinococcus humi TaxID=662880 RepID=A0A7W8ND91_9DEIO|nr:recombinase family protein [Deinococcus humi]MBB5362116.1 DNA invertase Pin-like site-specific DNA recombinase [Deinococcus humi]GGO21992.1 hypothetical protein GCM10008949_08810 [Deinococcus humi]
MTPPTIGGIRVSTDMQADRYGPDRQREDITREAERAGLVITDWVEESITGTDHARAAENRYYQLARQHQGVNVVFSHPNRVGRHVEVTVGIARTIHQLGGTVWIAGTGNLRDRRNWKNFLRDAAEAESDHADIVDRLQRGKSSKAARNLWPHGQPPYGYRIVRDDRGKSLTIEPHPETGPVVREIFDRALAGQGSPTIAAYLIQAGVTVPRPHKSSQGLWTQRHVLYILNNEAYTGRRVFTGPGGETSTVTFEGLVTPAEFRQVRQLVSGRRTNRAARTRFPALWAGHLRCGLCGGSMSVFSNYNTNKAGEQTHYINYRCRNTYNTGVSALLAGAKNCNHRRVHNHTKVDEAGWQLFVQAMTDPAVLVASLPAEASGPDHSARLAELRTQMAETVRRAVAHHLPDDVLTSALEPLRDEMRRLERDSLPPPAQPAPDMTGLAAQMTGHLAGLSGLEERREALDTWAARLVLGPEGIERVEVTVYRR